MYSWIWRRLPGATPVRALISALLAFAAVYVLFQYVFPWAEPLMPFNDVTVNGTSGSSTSSSPSPSATGTGKSSINGAALPRAVVGRAVLVSTVPGA